MRRTLLAGGLLALFAALLVNHGGHLGVELTKVALMGASLGAVLGLVPDRTPTGRAIAFLLGFVVSWVGYALRAGLLPDIPLGRAIAAFVVVAVVTAIAMVSFGRLPLWAGLVGVGVFAGAYETTFNLAPTAFATESITAATTALLAAAVGFLAGSLTGELGTADDDVIELPEGRLATAGRFPAQRDTGIAIVTEAPATRSTEA